jgi:hypothetical protein
MASPNQTGPRDFSDLLKPVPESIREVATQLRKIIKTTLPDADEAFYGGSKMGMVLYSIDGPNNVICGIQPADSICKLFFHGWKRLGEAGYRLEGSGKNARHIKIRSPDEIEPDELAQMLMISRRAVGK